ncbi:hypothetical protein Tco_0938404 [Tanacetum coccineum]|uniref:Uncharacterized protein n=1 Tax=Tanacetum coccineum TaxID=301880 RepID=A0ABQ5DHR5_9ASTR
MDEDFYATAYPSVHDNLKLRTDEHVTLESPPSTTEPLLSLKNLDDTYNFGDQFINDKPTKDDQNKSNVEAETVFIIPDPSHQTDTSAPPVVLLLVINILLLNRPSTPVHATNSSQLQRYKINNPCIPPPYQHMLIEFRFGLLELLIWEKRMSIWSMPSDPDTRRLLIFPSKSLNLELRDLEY